MQKQSKFNYSFRFVYTNGKIIRESEEIIYEHHLYHSKYFFNILITWMISIWTDLR